MRKLVPLFHWTYRKQKRICGKLFACLLVLTMQTVYVKLSGAPWDIVLNFLLLCTGLVLVCDSNIIISKYTLYIICISIALFMLIPLCHMFFLNGTSVNYSALILITMMCTVLFTICVIYISSVGIKRFLDEIADVIVFFTTTSLFLYFVGQVFHIIKPTNVVSFEWGGRQTTNSYFYLLFTPQAQTAYHSFKNGRFTGIFTEAPMCAFVLCAALIIILFVSDRTVCLSSVVILCIGIYATVSTTGYIVALLSLGAYVFMLKPASKQMQYARILLSSILFVVLLYVVFSLYQEKTHADVGSVSIRSNNYENAILNFYASPIYGLGFKSDAIGVTGGNTSVYSSVLQQGGLLFACWYFTPMLLSILKAIRIGVWRYAIALTLYAVLMYATVVTYTGFSIAIVAVCWVALIPAKEKTSSATHRMKISVAQQR